MERPWVLVVEDDPAIRQGLADALEYAGYRVRQTGDGEEAAELAAAPDLSLVLLDVLLPRKTGFEVLREVRRHRPGLPVILVTARGAEEDRVRGLEDGADDYVVKPFSAREVLARVAAVLRRSAERPSGVQRLSCDGRTVHLERREVEFRDGRVSHLSEKETAILQYLALHAGRAITREELLQRVWGLVPRGLETRTVDMHVARLREKLGEREAASKILLTLRSRGYMLGQEVRTEGP